MNNEQIDKQILLVDDNDFDRRLLMRALARKANYKLLDVNSGQACLDLVNSMKIDLILMDVMMPDMDGNEILNQIRKKYNAVELPVIMITGKTDASDIIKSLQLGANDYISKPVNFDVAMTRVSTQLKISDLSQEMGRLQEIAALHAMVATYNHEINNPLTIAIANLSSFQESHTANTELKNTENALWRVAEIVSKIKEISQKPSVAYTEYNGGKNMLKIK